MNQKQFETGLKKILKSNFQIFGPVFNSEKKVVYKNLKEVKDFIFTPLSPLISFKKYLLPNSEEIAFFNKKGDYFSKKPKVPETIIWGLNLLDLQALTTLSYFFRSDPFFQTRHQKTFIFAHNLLPPKGEKNFFGLEYKRDYLKNLIFDVFFELNQTKPLKILNVFAGSKKGENILREFFKIKATKIDFQGPSEELNRIFGVSYWPEKIVSAPLDFWENLGKLCIECGKCSIVCPVCYCFRFSDVMTDLDIISKKRELDSCFYVEFSEVAGNNPKAPKNHFLKNTRERIFFWYEHHFLRMPQESGLPGCVGCGRCIEACPVGINLFKNLKILKENRKKQK